MNTRSRPRKLTLRLDSELIEQAKQYARERGTSLSQMVAGYFQALIRQEGASTDDASWEQELGPLTRSLLGTLEGSEADEEEYRRHLEEKYLGRHGEDRPA